MEPLKTIKLTNEGPYNSVVEVAVQGYVVAAFQTYWAGEHPENGVHQLECKLRDFARGKLLDNVDILIDRCTNAPPHSNLHDLGMISYNHTKKAEYDQRSVFRLNLTPNRKVQVIWIQHAVKATTKRRPESHAQAANWAAAHMLRAYANTLVPEQLGAACDPQTLAKRAIARDLRTLAKLLDDTLNTEGPQWAVRLYKDACQRVRDEENGRRVYLDE